MIFVLGKKEPRLFCMLSEKDVAEMRTGVTKFVDAHQLGEATFTGVTFSLHKSDEESKQLIQNLMPGVARMKMAVPMPTPEEVSCPGCQGIMRPEQLFEGKCTVCWATEAKSLRSKP